MEKKVYLTPEIQVISLQPMRMMTGSDPDMTFESNAGFNYGKGSDQAARSRRRRSPWD